MFKKSLARFMLILRRINCRSKNNSLKVRTCIVGETHATAGHDDPQDRGQVLKQHNVHAWVLQGSIHQGPDKHVRLLVGRLLGLSVCHNFIKGQE